VRNATQVLLEQTVGEAADKYDNVLVCLPVLTALHWQRISCHQLLIEDVAFLLNMTQPVDKLLRKTTVLFVYTVFPISIQAQHTHNKLIEYSLYVNGNDVTQRRNCRAQTAVPKCPAPSTHRQTVTNGETERQTDG